MGLLERSSIRIVRARLEPRHVAVAQSAGVFPERERGELVLSESQDDALVAGLIAEHGERARIARRSGMQLIEIDLLGRARLGARRKDRAGQDPAGPSRRAA